MPASSGLLLALIVVTAWRIAARTALGLDLHYDEAQYYAWSLDPAFGYFSKPPMIAWTIDAARAVCGESTDCLRAPSSLAFGITTALVYVLARRMFDTRVATVAGLVFLLAPLTSFYAWFITTDALLLLWWAAALVAFVYAVEARGTWVAWLGVGVFGGVGLLSKYTMGIFAVSALGFLVFDARARRHLRRPGPWLGVAVATALFAPNLVWNATHRFATLHHTAGIAQVDRAAFAPMALGRFLLEQIGVFGPLTAFAFVAALATWLVRRKPASARDVLDAMAAEWPRARAVKLLAWFSLPFVAIIAMQALVARALANWAAPTYVAASVLAALWLVERRGPRWRAAAIGLNALVAVIVYHHAVVLEALHVTLPPQRDPFAQVRGWQSLGHDVAQQLDTHHARLLADDRRTMSELIYYGGAGAHDALIWNPSRVVDHQYRLTRDVEQHPDGPFLFASEQAADPATLARQFASVAPLADLVSYPCAGCTRTLHVYLLGRFVGYR